MPRAKNIRTRLTLWYALAFMVILLGYALISLSFVYLNMRRDLDHELEEDYEILENIIRILPDGSVTVEAQNDPYLHERWFDVYGLEGNKIYESRPFSARLLPPPTPQELDRNGFQFRSLRLSNGVRVRMLFGKTNFEGRWLFIRLMRLEDELWRDLWAIARMLLIALPFALIIAGLGGYLMTRKMLAPVERMAEKARRIGETNLQERLPIQNPDDELGRLAQSFNELLERIEKSFNRLKQFTADASHELRTPLTAIQSIGEVSLQNDRDRAYYRDVIGSILEENRRLTRLVDSLLFLSKADNDRISVRKQTFGLRSFVKQTIEFIQPLAEEKDQTIRLSGDEKIQVTADRDLLREAVLNILDNAIKYSPQQTTISVEIARTNRETTIAVKDQGIGIPADQTGKIFERFYRVDKARARELGGSGLGLAISLWAVRVQGGTIRVESRESQGSTFTIVLPAMKNKSENDKTTG